MYKNVVKNFVYKDVRFGNRNDSLENYGFYIKYILFFRFEDNWC